MTIFFTLQLPKGGLSVNWWGNTVFMNSAFPSFFSVVLLAHWSWLWTDADFNGLPLVTTSPDNPLPN